MRKFKNGYMAKPIQLVLGKHYLIGYYYNNKAKLCKLIQPTKCGFNFLNVETNKCVLKRHLYPSKSPGHESGDWYWVNVNLLIKEL